MPFADQETVVRADRRDLAPDRGRGEAQVLEVVHELAQLCRGNGIGAAGALGAGVGDEAPDVAQVVTHGIRAVAGLEGEVIAELRHVKGAVAIVHGHSHRRTRVV